MKKNIDLARAWRDEDYFLSLTDEERASLGAHPAGVIDDEVLRSIAGGCNPGPGIEYTNHGYTAICTYCGLNDCGV